jgi:hypothetical protein
MLHKRHSLAGLIPNIGGGSTNKGEQKRQLVGTRHLALMLYYILYFYYTPFTS